MPSAAYNLIRDAVVKLEARAINWSISKIYPTRKGPLAKEIKAAIKKTARDYRKTLRKLA